MISVPSALLCSSLPELADGETLCELSRELYRQLRRAGAGPAGSFSSRSDGPEDVPACLQFFVDAFGYEALPRLLTDVRCAERIALAHVPTIAAFVCFLRDRIGETELLLQRSGGNGEEISSASSRSGNYGHNPVYITSAAASGVSAQLRVARMFKRRLIQLLLIRYAKNELNKWHLHCQGLLLLPRHCLIFLWIV